MSSPGWKLVAIAGGGTIIIGGGYFIYQSFFKVSPPLEPPKEKKKGKFEQAFSWLFGEGTTDKIGNVLGGVGDFLTSVLHGGSNFIDSTSQIPGTLITIITWGSIIGVVLIAILVIVFCYRMAIGDTPDLAGGITQIASAIPQVKGIPLK